MAARSLKIVLYSIICGFSIVAIYLAAIFAFAETIFGPNPEVDTQFTSEFSKTKFESITPGMTTKQVRSLLGEPFVRHGGPGYCWDGKSGVFSVSHNMSPPLVEEVPIPSEGSESWAYSKDDGCAWFDFAWLEYRVEMQNDVVTKTEKCWHGD